MDPLAALCFEVSWEVCNKVGGIYTVVTSKAACMMSKYRHNYIAVGPFFPKKAFGSFEEKLAPEDIRPVFDDLKNVGLVCHFGTWLIKGSPSVILIDFSGFSKNTNDIKRNLWDWFGVDSLGTTWFDFDEPVVWSYAVGILLERVAKVRKDQRIVAHFHEWLAGAGLLYLKKMNIPIAKVFTTHATMLGRTIASANMDCFEVCKKINPDEEARRRGVLPKHQMERGCAKNAEVFTTVSEITGIEAEQLLGRKPDVLTLNGLDLMKFPTFEEASIKHRQIRERMREFCMYYFFPYYTFDLDETLFYFLAGRYEFHDKGIDMFIKALAEINRRLQAEKSPKTIVAFIWVPGNVKGIKSELLEGKTFYGDLADSIDHDLPEIRRRIASSLIGRQDISKELLFNEDQLQDLKRKVFRILRSGKAPVCTHDLFDEQSDAIISALYAEGLDNGPEDRVKVIFYPIYLTGTDTLLNTTYYESMHGCHLGVFPSFYEPWGYTPLEASALCVPSVTTDLAGFGRYVCATCPAGKTSGVFVLKRLQVSDESFAQALTNQMYDYAMLSVQERVQTKINARAIAEQADWRNFIEYYIEAHNKAVERLNA